jgi:hypothetical protein
MSPRSSSPSSGARSGLLLLVSLCAGACDPQPIGALENAQPDAAPPPTDDGGVAPPPPADARPGSDVAAPDAAVRTNCPPGPVTPEEVAATPRANTQLELLAMHLSKGKVVADQAIYDRLVRDLPAIRAVYPALASYFSMGRSFGSTIMIWPDAVALRQMRNGTYEPWACPNQLYGVTRSNLSGVPGGLTTVTFKGVYNTRLLAAEYARMPGVERAEPDGGGLPAVVTGTSAGNSYKILCATPEGRDLWHYVFAELIARGGRFAHFTVGADGVVNAVGNYEACELGGAPAWVRQYVNPDSCSLPGGSL